MATTRPLARRLGLADAVAIGLGSMLGAGVFAAFAPAAAAAGSGLLIGLMIAGIVAYGNAASSAQLAAQFPTSGGAYASGRELLGPWPGYLAGWSFVIGKTASCAAMALTVAAYLAPAGWQKPVAVAAVLALTGLNLLGVTRTAAVAKVVVVIVLAALAIGVSAATAAADPARLALTLPGGAYGVLQSAGLLFFAFAGYARIATMGEEVRDPGRTIPRAIMIALGTVLVVYLIVALALLGALGPERLAASPAPLADAAAAWPWTAPVVRAGAGIAALGALLALIAGVSRTVLAMARTGDLPAWLSAVGARSVPHRAELALGVVVCALVLLTDLRGAIGFSSFGVLLYYLVANAAALRQGPGDRRFPRAVSVVGATGCIVLVATLPWPSIVAGAVVLAVGVVVRIIRRAAAR